jgi:hypothetical protein
MFPQGSFKHHDTISFKITGVTSYNGLISYFNNIFLAHVAAASTCSSLQADFTVLSRVHFFYRLSHNVRASDQTNDRLAFYRGETLKVETMY